MPYCLSPVDSIGGLLLGRRRVSTGTGMCPMRLRWIAPSRLAIVSARAQGSFHAKQRALVRTLGSKV